MVPKIADEHDAEFCIGFEKQMEAPLEIASFVRHVCLHLSAVEHPRISKFIHGRVAFVPDALCWNLVRFELTRVQPRARTLHPMSQHSLSTAWPLRQARPASLRPLRHLPDVCTSSQIGRPISERECMSDSALPCAPTLRREASSAPALLHRFASMVLLQGSIRCVPHALGERGESEKKVLRGCHQRAPA